MAGAVGYLLRGIGPSAALCGTGRETLQHGDLIGAGGSRRRRTSGPGACQTDQQQVEQMMVGNPRTIFEKQGAY